MANDVVLRELAPDETLQSVYDLVLMPAFTPDELEPLYKLREYLEASPEMPSGSTPSTRVAIRSAAASITPIGTRARYCWGTWRSWLMGEVAAAALGCSRKARADGSTMINTIS